MEKLIVGPVLVILVIAPAALAKSLRPAHFRLRHPPLAAHQIERTSKPANRIKSLGGKETAAESKISDICRGC
jgi:hypothetical protein